jgi:hypothetical protein
MRPIDFATVADGIDTDLAGAVVPVVKAPVIAVAAAPFAARPAGLPILSFDFRRASLSFHCRFGAGCDELNCVKQC